MQSPRRACHGDDEESSLLFALMAERCERRLLGITSNLVFSEGEPIFTTP